MSPHGTRHVIHPHPHTFLLTYSYCHILVLNTQPPHTFRILYSKVWLQEILVLIVLTIVQNVKRLQRVPPFHLSDIRDTHTNPYTFIYNFQSPICKASHILDIHHPVHKVGLTCSCAGDVGQQQGSPCQPVGHRSRTDYPWRVTTGAWCLAPSSGMAVATQHLCSPGTEGPRSAAVNPGVRKCWAQHRRHHTPPSSYSTMRLAYLSLLPDKTPR